MATAAEATITMEQEPSKVISTPTDGRFPLEKLPGMQVWSSLQVLPPQLSTLPEAGIKGIVLSKNHTFINVLFYLFCPESVLLAPPSTVTNPHG